MRSHRYQPLVLLSGVIALLVLAGCNFGSAESDEDPVVEVTTTSASLPTLAAPTEAPASLGLYWGIEGRQIPDSFEAVASTRAGELGLVYHRISPGDALPEGMMYLILIGGTDLNLAGLSVSSETQVLVFGTATLEGENVTRIIPGTDDMRRLGFVSGYLSAVVADEWRVGLLANPTSDGAFQEGFGVGMDYLCGLCQQAFPPFYSYPLVETWNPDIAAFPESAAQRIRSGEVRAYVLAPGISPSLTLPTEGVFLRAMGYGEGITPGYTGFVRFEEIPGNFEAILSAWLNRESVQAEWLFAVGSNDSGEISEGKLTFVRDLFPLLYSGSIVP